MALGLLQSGQAADLIWYPTASASWDTVSTNWWLSPSLDRVPYANGDNVLFDANGTFQPVVDLGANTLTPGSVVVEAPQGAQYSLYSATTGKLDGSMSLAKRGAGTLVLEANNTISGPTTIEEGTLSLGSGASSKSGALGTGMVTNNGALVYNRTNTLNFYNPLCGSGRLAVPDNGKATGTWNVRGTNNMTDYSIEVSGAILYFTNAFSLGSPTNLVMNPSASNPRFQMGGGVTLPATCPITVAVSAGNNTIRASIMSMAGSNSVNGPIRLTGGYAADPNSRPYFNLYSQGTTAEISVTSAVEDVVEDPFLGNFYLRGNSTVGVGRMYGRFNLPSAQFIKEETSTWTIYSTGNVATNTYLAAGRLNLAAADALPNAQLIVNGTLDLGGFDQHVGPLWSLSSTAGVITNSSAVSARLILANGGSYQGRIVDNGTAKIGLEILSAFVPAAQQLHGANTYSGPTILQPAAAIALMTSGSIANSTPIEMYHGSSIDVLNRTDKTLTLGAGQTLAADGTVHIAGNLVSQGTLAFKVSKAGTSVTADQVAIASGYSVTYGGTLKLALSGDALGAGDWFKLFNADSYAESFAAVSPATPGPGTAWDTSSLRVDGTLKVVNALPTTPTNLTMSVSAGQMRFSWPSEYLGWTLQVQTNAPGTGIGTGWLDVTGSSSMTEISLPIDPDLGSAFYRLRY